MIIVRAILAMIMLLRGSQSKKEETKRKKITTTIMKTRTRRTFVRLTNIPSKTKINLSSQLSFTMVAYHS